MDHFPKLLAFIAMLSLAACGRDEPEAPSAEPSEAEEPAPSEDRAVERAAEARDTLSRRMMGRVQEAVAEGGHARAVEVCNEEAPAITRAVGEELGVKVGRTAERIRNPENAPPAWVAEKIEDRPRAPIHEREGDGTLRALFPIFLGEPCLKCHGGESELAPGVKDVLAERYPDDRATGFSAGDLRGWLWVEVPPA